MSYFNHQIAYEIRLQQAMEEESACVRFTILELRIYPLFRIRSQRIYHEDFNKLTM